MIKKLMNWFIIAVICVAIYNFVGGDVGDAIRWAFDKVVRLIMWCGDWLISLPIVRDILGA